MATVGQSLGTPEPGWQRIDQNSPKVYYSWGWSVTSSSVLYGGTVLECTNNAGASYTFRFYGTKLRIIGAKYITGSDVQEITIDGVKETFSQYSGDLLYQTLSYEKTGLSLGYHTVTVVNTKAARAWLDAIDIDSDGFLTAVIGQQSTIPEAGWRRYDDANPLIVYKGNWTVQTGQSTTVWYNGTAHFAPSGVSGQEVKFRFYGSKVRIIGNIDVAANRTSNLTITIDGTNYTYSEVGAANITIALVFEKLGLPLAVHEVVIKAGTVGGLYAITFDSIDIDSDGYLVAQQGSVLATPESGWLRAAATDSKLVYSGTWVTNTQVPYTTTTGSKLTFKFKGTKLRLLGLATPGSWSTDVRLKVDGVEHSFNPNVYSTNNYTVIFEITELSNSVHTAEYYGMNLTSAAGINFQAADIDSDGYLVTQVGNQLTAPEQGWRRYDDSDPLVRRTGSWTLYSYGSGNSHYWQNGQWYTTDPTATMEFSFVGTKLRFIVPTFPGRADVEIFVDGARLSSFTLSRASGTQVFTLAYELTGLPSGEHHVMFRRVSGTTGEFASDAIDIDSDGYLVAQMGQTLTAPELGWRRYDDSDPLIVYTGSWSKGTTGVYLNTEHYATGAANKASFKFKGTSLRLIGRHTSGKSENITIRVDNVPYVFSQYAVTTVDMALSFELAGLESTVTHTVVIEAPSDTKNLSLDAIDIDETGFLVAQQGSVLSAPETGWQRINENDPKLAYTGTWTSATGSVWGGTSKYAESSASKLTIKFKGTKIRLISTGNQYRTETAKVKVDGVEYTINPRIGWTNLYYLIIFEATGLPDTEHIVEYYGIGLSTGVAIEIDAIDIDAIGYLVAKVGQPLTTPEPGWQRADERDPHFQYTGTWKSAVWAGWQSTAMYTEVSSSRLTFKFKGTKLRIISTIDTSRTPKGRVRIDGVEYNFNPKATGLVFQVIVFEVKDLEDTIHIVEYYGEGIAVGSALDIDAIDIDDDGYLIGTTGTQMLTPGAGWKRTDVNPTSAFKFVGVWSIDAHSAYYGGTLYVTNTSSNSVTFKFYGTRVRVVGPFNTGHSALCSASVDGVEEIFSMKGGLQQQKNAYEKSGLVLGVHTVTLKTTNTEMIALDAIDVDSAGRILHPDEVMTPNELIEGKRIRCNYQAYSGLAGTFSNLGKETNDFLPITGLAAPKGDFYFITYKGHNGKLSLMADRVLQLNVTWEALNLYGFAYGRQLNYDMQSSIVGAWNFNETGGTVLSDLVERNNGTITGTTVVDGVSGKARHFGGNDGISFPTSVIPTGAKSIRIRFRRNGIISTGQILLTTGLTAGVPNARTGMSLFIEENTGKVQYVLWNNSTAQTANLSSPASVSDNLWHDVLVTTDSTGLTKLYVDNMTTPVATAALPIEGAHSGPMTVGYTTLSGWPYNFTGDIDSIEIYNTAIDPHYVNQPSERFLFNLRMPTGGVTVGDIDNEWDRYVVDSTLGGTITKGDTNVWNWGRWNHTSTTPQVGSRVLSGTAAATWRVIRGYGTGTVTRYDAIGSGYGDANGGFRPVLIVQRKDDLIISAIANSPVHDEDIVLTGFIESSGKQVRYRVELNGQEALAFGAFEDAPASIHVTFPNDVIVIGTSVIRVVAENSDGLLTEISLSVVKLATTKYLIYNNGYKAWRNGNWEMVSGPSAMEMFMADGMDSLESTYQKVTRETQGGEVETFRPLMILQGPVHIETWTNDQASSKLLTITGEAKVPVKYKVEASVGVPEELSTNAVPVMTGPITPSGEASASSTYQANVICPAWMAFDKVKKDYLSCWATPVGTVTGWIQYRFNTTKTITRYRLYTQYYYPANRAPKNWTLKGSNNGVDFVSIDNRVDITGWLNDGATYKEFNVESPQPFLFYRLDITANNGATDHVVVGEWEMFETALVPTEPTLLLKDWTVSYDKVDETALFESSKFVTSDPYLIIVTAVNEVTGEEISKFGKVVLSNEKPGLSATLTGMTLALTVGDPDDDNIQYQVRLNNRIVYPVNGQEFTDLTPGPQNYRRTFLSNEITIGGNNVLAITAKDQFGAISTATFDFIGEYSGLMFCDENDEFYSTDLGEMLMYLDTGVLIIGQISMAYPIKLKNKSGFVLTNLLLTKDDKSLPAGAVIEISYAESPFVPESHLSFSDILRYDQSVTFYVRLNASEAERPGSGEFELVVKADPVDE